MLFPAFAPFMYFAPGDGGSGGNEDPPADGDGQGPEITDEVKTQLKRAGIDLENLTPESVAAAFGKVSHFKAKADDLQKQLKSKDAENRGLQQQLQDLQAAKVVDAEGKVDSEALKSLTDKAGLADYLNSLLTELIDQGHISGRIAEIIRSEKPADWRMAIKYAKPADPADAGNDDGGGSDEDIDAIVERKVQEELKRRGVNTNTRPYSGDASGAKDEMKKMVEQTNKNLEEVTTGMRQLPGESGGT